MCSGRKKVINSYQVLLDSIFLKITLFITWAKLRWLIPTSPYKLEYKTFSLLMAEEHIIFTWKKRTHK